MVDCLIVACMFPLSRVSCMPRQVCSACGLRREGVVGFVRVADYYGRCIGTTFATYDGAPPLVLLCLRCGRSALNDSADRFVVLVTFARLCTVQIVGEYCWRVHCRCCWQKLLSGIAGEYWKFNVASWSCACKTRPEYQESFLPAVDNHSCRHAHVPDRVGE